MKISVLFSLCLLAVGCGGYLSDPSSTMAVASQKVKPSVVQLAEAPLASSPSAKAKITHLARGNNAYLGHLWIAPNAGVPLHRDLTEEYLFVMEGGGMLTMNGSNYALTVGSAVFMPAGAEVKFQNGDAATIVLQVFAGPASAYKYQKWQIQ